MWSEIPIEHKCDMGDLPYAALLMYKTFAECSKKIEEALASGRPRTECESEFSPEPTTEAQRLAYRLYDYKQVDSNPSPTESTEATAELAMEKIRVIVESATQAQTISVTHIIEENETHGSAMKLDIGLGDENEWFVSTMGGPRITIKEKDLLDPERFKISSVNNDTTHKELQKLKKKAQRIRKEEAERREFEL